MGSLRLENVHKKYGGVEAVKGVSVECRNGEFIAILGPSGAGKTSMLRMIAGLTKIDEGKIWIDDTLMNDVAPYDRNIAMAFERYVLYPFLTVFENIAFPLRVPIRKGEFTESELESRVAEVARFLEIEPLLNRQATELSGGQRQRVSLGRALVRPANLFLLDEPLSHLDAKLRNRLRGELKRRFKDLGCTVVYVTHDFREAMSMADKILILDKGQSRQYGSPHDVFARPADAVVADMVGDPPIELLKCDLLSREGNYYIRTEHFELPLSQTWSEKLNGSAMAPKGLIVGIRPVYTRVGTTETARQACIRGEVFVTEPAGSKQVLFVTVGKTKLKTVVDARFRANIGENVTVEIDLDRIQLFDQTTLKSIA